MNAPNEPLCSCCTFEVEFEDDAAFELEFCDDTSFEADFGEYHTIVIGGAEYTGEYSVTPKIYESQTLPTKNRRMNDDVKIHKIPTYEVSNASGGATLIIGNESIKP